jgi:hypothetical protein
LYDGCRYLAKTISDMPTLSGIRAVQLNQAFHDFSTMAKESKRRVIVDIAGWLVVGGFAGGIVAVVLELQFLLIPSGLAVLIGIIMFMVG